MSQISFTDKVAASENLNIPEVNKITANNINEIKESVNALYTGSGGAPTLLKQRITLTESEIDVLFSSPYLAIAAPGVGKMIVIIGTYRELIAGTTPYDNGLTDSLFIRMNSVNSLNIFNINPASSVFGVFSTASTPNVNNENQAIYLSSDADFTQGDGVLNIIIYHTIEDVF